MAGITTTRTQRKRLILSSVLVLILFASFYAIRSSSSSPGEVDRHQEDPRDPPLAEEFHHQEDPRDAKYNLVTEERLRREWEAGLSTEQCTTGTKPLDCSSSVMTQSEFLEFINSNKLQQDHPCVIDIIRRQFLQWPSPRDVPYNLGTSTDPNGDPSPGQAQHVLRLLKNQVKECVIPNCLGTLSSEHFRTDGRILCGMRSSGRGLDLQHSVHGEIPPLDRPPH